MYDEFALYFDSDKFEHIMTFQRFDYQRRSSEDFGKIFTQVNQFKFLFFCVDNFLIFFKHCEFNTN